MGDPPAALAASVVVCTHDRIRLLSRCLAALASQSADGLAFEVIVVDNASAGLVEGVAEEWSARLPDLRYVREARLGLSHARNRGIEEARGEVVAFIDDDAAAEPGWLRALLAPFDAPSVGAAGGRVRIEWEPGPPSWCAPELHKWYSAFDLGDRPRLMEGKELPFGTNMAIRREVAVDLRGFSPLLGRVGRRNLMSNEEIDLFLRVVDDSRSIAYAPGAVVTHLVTAERASPVWIVRRAYSQGRSNARLGSVRTGPRAVPFPNRVSNAAKQAVVAGWGEATRRIFAGPNRRSATILDTARRAAEVGFVVERLRQHARRRVQTGRDSS